MKKILSRFFSATLIAALAVAPAVAQPVKKAKAVSNTPSELTMKATKALKRGDNGYALQFYNTRTSKVKQAKGLVKEASKTAVSVRQNALQAPALEGADVPVLCGAVVYNDELGEGTAEAGLYVLPSSADGENELIIEASPISSGVCVNGIYYATGYDTFWGMIFGISAWEIDTNTPEIVNHWSLDTNDLSPICMAMAYDPTSGLIYGVGYNATGSALTFRTMTFTNSGVTVNDIAECDVNWNSLMCDKNGQLYGISYEGDSSSGSFVVTKSTLCKIDKATGEYTVIGETGVLPQYLSSATIDTKTGRCFWNVCPSDEMGYIYEVNLTTGAATLLYKLPLNDEVQGMYVKGPLAEDGAPAACSDVAVNFTDGSLQGTMTLTAPATLFDGTAGSGELSIIVMANGEQIGYADATWGAATTIDLDMSAMGAGLYNFTVFASNEVGMGPRTQVKGIFVGSDTPAATTATLVYENGNMEVTWLPVTETINGGYMDLSKLTYTVLDKEDNVKAEGLTVCTWSEAVEDTGELVTYQYKVVVVCDGLESAPAVTNTIGLGNIVPPYTSNFAEDGLNGWTILDENADGKVWTIVDGALRMSYNGTMEMDDWAITPGIKLEAGKAYGFAFDAWNNSSNYVETLEVKMGTAPDAAAMTTTVIEATDIQSNNVHVPFETMIVPETDGIYYIGFHGISASDQYYLYVGDFTIEEGVSALAPGEGVITATADATGAKSATVNVTFPSKTMNGQNLTSLTKAEILRGDEVIKTFTNPTVGGTDSYVDNAAANGNNTYTLVCYNDEGKGLKATTTVFVGFDKPAPMAEANIATTGNEGEVTVTWSPVTTDVNGLAYPSGAITYVVTKYVNNNWEPISDELTELSYTFQAVEAGTQDFVQCAVFPYYEGAQGTGAATDMIPVGTPYDGLDETFANGTLSYIWGLTSAPSEYGLGGGSVSINLDDTISGITSADGDGGYVAFKCQTLDSSVMLFTGLVSLNQMINPGVTFYTYNIVGEDPADIDVNLVNVYVKDMTVENPEWTVVLSKPVNELCGAAGPNENVDEGWYKVNVALDEYANKTVQIGFEAVTKMFQFTFLDDIKVGSILDNDLKASSITAPAKVKAGADYTVDVVVANEGSQDAASYSVELYADQELVETKTLENLASGAKNTVVFERSMSAIATEPVTYYAKVVYAADENEANNQTSDATVEVVVPTVPVATNLEGTCADGAVNLTWDEPVLANNEVSPNAITEDFEDAEGFSAEYGDWTFVDMDQSFVGGFQGIDLPGIVPGETMGSFWIWDKDLTPSANQTFDAHSGTKYLFALFRWDDGTTDDWAISPSLSGDAQTITFWARSYSTSYPEKISVYYTTEDTVDPEAYELVEGSTVNSVPGDWTLYSVDLPDGATHFAIRSHATGSFMLMVDDVTFEPGNGTPTPLEIVGYNVYRDGVKINDALVEECAYTDSNVVEGETYTYVVTVVYASKGESAASNEAVVVVNNSGVDKFGAGSVQVTVKDHNVVVLNAEGLDVTVAAANGAVLFNGKGEAKTTISTGAGVFVVKAGNTVKKVIVK